MNGGGKSLFDTIKHPGTNVSGCFIRSIALVGNAVPGVPAAEGGNSMQCAGAKHLRNAGDGVPYAQF